MHTESLAIWRELGDPAGMSENLAASGCLLATAGKLPAALHCVAGAQQHDAQAGFAFEPVVRGLLEQGLAIIEHPGSGLPAAERERLQAQAKAMSINQLAQFALNELAQL